MPWLTIRKINHYLFYSPCVILSTSNSNHYPFWIKSVKKLYSDKSEIRIRAEFAKDFFMNKEKNEINYYRCNNFIVVVLKARYFGNPVQLAVRGGQSYNGNERAEGTQLTVYL